MNSVRAALASPVWPVIVVLGAHAATIRPHLTALPVLTVENSAWESGMASSLVCGLNTALAFSRNLAGVIISPCDQPALQASHFSRLLDAARAQGVRIAAHRYANHLGAPAWFDGSLFAPLATLSGDAGARALLRTLPKAEIAICESPELAFDIDTPADALALQNQAPRTS